MSYSAGQLARMVATILNEARDGRFSLTKSVEKCFHRWQLADILVRALQIDVEFWWQLRLSEVLNNDERSRLKDQSAIHREEALKWFNDEHRYVKRVPRFESSERSFFRRVVVSALRRERDDGYFTTQEDELYEWLRHQVEQSRQCRMCGTELLTTIPERDATDGRYTPNLLSLDKVNPQVRTYCKDNRAVVCNGCNKFKAHLPLQLAKGNVTKLQQARLPRLKEDGMLDVNHKTNVVWTEKDRESIKKKAAADWYLLQGRVRQNPKKVASITAAEIAAKLAQCSTKIGFFICQASGLEFGWEELSWDRIDSEKGYSADNTRAIHVGLNLMRGRMPDDSVLHEYWRQVGLVRGQ